MSIYMNTIFYFPPSVRPPLPVIKYQQLKQCVKCSFTYRKYRIKSYKTFDCKCCFCIWCLEHYYHSCGYSLCPKCGESIEPLLDCFMDGRDESYKVRKDLRIRRPKCDDNGVSVEAKADPPLDHPSTLNQQECKK